MADPSVRALLALNAVELAYATERVLQEQTSAQQNGPGIDTYYAMLERLFIEAFEAHRSAGSDQPTLDRVHQKILDYQRLKASTLGEISVPIDMTEQVRAIESALLGQEAPIALHLLARRMGFVRTRAFLSDQVQRRFQQSPLMGHMPLTHIDHRGRTVGVVPTLDQSGTAAAQESVETRLMQAAGEDFDLQGHFTIQIARECLISEHAFGLQDWHDLTVHSSFVPDSHELTMAKALDYGMRGMWTECLYLIAPCIEAALRAIVEDSGAIVSNFQASGIQHLESLSAIFAHHRARLVTVLSEDVTYALQVLCDEAVGPNLRNRALHGLMLDTEVESGPLIYLWWLVLRLTLLGIHAPPSPAPPTA
jgi:hypothetical protein